MKIRNTPLSIPKNLILALKNLQSLEVGRYRSMQNFKEDFNWIVKNAPKLEVLKYCSINVEKIVAYYQLLKPRDVSINQNINIEAIA